MKYGAVLQQRGFSSVFKTDGDAVTPWCPQSFRAVTLESQRWTEESATVNNQGDVRIREPRDPMLRFSSRLLLVRDAAYFGMSSLGQGGNSDVITKTTICSACAIPQQCGTVLMFQLNCSGIFCRGHGVDGSSEPSSSSQRSAVWTSPAVCSFESQLLTEDGATVDPSNGPWHGDVRSGEPRDPMFRFSSR